jgi:hypothetical protein
MKSLFDNLHLYEIVLLFLGIFLFVILSVGLAYYIIKKEEFKKLLFFFPMSIIMIGYPSIQEIRVEKDKITIIKYMDKILENPDDVEVNEELARITKKLEKRASAPEDLKVVSVANLLLGNSEKVIELANKAINEKTESNPETKEDSITKNIKIKTFTEIRKLATIQNDFKKDSTILIDTTLFKQQLEKIPWDNPKTKDFLNKKTITK